MTFQAMNGESLLIKYRPIIMVGLWRDWTVDYEGYSLYIGCVLSQLKHSQLYNLSYENGLGLFQS